METNAYYEGPETSFEMFGDLYNKCITLNYYYAKFFSVHVVST